MNVLSIVGQASQLFTVRPTIHTASVCGHEIPPPIVKNQCIPYCSECLNDMSIQCAKCNGLIRPYEHITLVKVEAGEKQAPHATVYVSEDGSESIVCCLHTTCASHYVVCCGQWVPPGVVKDMRT